MVSEFTIQTVGTWNKQMSIPLRSVIDIVKDLYRKSAPEACKRTVIYMAKSASAITPKAPALRPVHTDQTHLLGRGGEYVKVYKKTSSTTARPVKMFRYEFSKKNRTLEGTFAQARKIANHGMASNRSWMWQLRGGKSAPRGASQAYAFKAGKDNVGFVKRNKLGYIMKIMPAGWLDMVTRAATNKIMKVAAIDMEKKYRRLLARVGKAS
jgi:hypothetical protein